MELEILYSCNLCSHDVIVDHISYMGRKVIPYICVDILDIQCHDVHPTLFIGTIHSQHQIQPIHHILKIWLEVFH